MRLLLALVVLLAGTPALADTKPRRIGIIGLDAADRASADLAAGLSAALENPWPTSRVVLLRPKDTARVRKQCPTRAAPCLAKAGAELGLDGLVIGTVEPIGTDAHHVTVRLFDVWTRRVGAIAVTRLHDATWRKQLDRAVGELVRQLGDRKAGAMIDI